MWGHVSALQRSLKEKTTQGGFSPGAEHAVTCWAAPQGSDRPQEHSGVPTSMAGTYLGQAGTSQLLTAPALKPGMKGRTHPF